MPARTLPGQRTEIAGNFGPANRVGDKLDVVIRSPVEQVPVHPRNQVNVLANRPWPVSADQSHDVRAENAERAGDDHQHVSLRQGFSADQEGAEILDDLDDFDALSRQPHAPKASPADFGAVQHAHDSAGANDALRIGEHGHHDA